MATAVINMVEDTYDAANYYLGDKQPSHSRSPSNGTGSRPTFDVSPKSSAVHLPPTSQPNLQDSTDKLDLSRAARTRSRTLIPRGEPIVTHGWTLSAPCGFRKVCEAIKESAFANNDLPIIISLEVHADQEQQNVMVKIMKEVWGDMLIQKPLEGNDPRFRLPALGELRNKILIKVKKAPMEVPAPLLSPSLRPTSTAVDDGTSSDDDRTPAATPNSSPNPARPTRPQEKSSKVQICEKLGELAVYTRSERFKGFDTPEAKKPPHIFSISEQQILDISIKSHQETFTHNRSYFMRAFPAGVGRVDSSNPDPSLFWRKGVQMVAMNWQHVDDGMMVNEGMFADEKGWALKPPGYQSKDKSIQTQEQAAPVRTLDLTVTIFAGHHITRHKDDDAEHGHITRSIRPKVRVTLLTGKPVGAGKDQQGHECTYRQSTEPGRTDHPSYGPNGAALEFLHIPNVVEELSFLRLVVKNMRFFLQLSLPHQPHPASWSASKGLGVVDSMVRHL